MATMFHFNNILESRGLEAAAQYAAAAQYGPGIRLAAELKKEMRDRPMRVGKTARDRKSGATARWQENRERRRIENQARCRQKGGGKKEK